MLNNLFQKGLERSRDSWFRRAMHLFDGNTLDPAVWDELEELLIRADVGMSTTEKLIQSVRQQAAERKLKEGPLVREALQAAVVDMLTVTPPPLPPVSSPPRITLVVGVNGSGKTTAIAKLAYRLKQAGRPVMLAAADTFRAAAIEQLRHWGEVVGAEVIAHQPGADPGAVVFDAVQAARSRGVPELIIDTAGRLHTKFNLMEELKKVRRVAAKGDSGAPHEVILVLDATTGQNGLTQARYFTEAVGVTGVFLAKLDGTARGGIVLAITDQLHLPIQYIGVGEGVEDVALFDAAAFAAALCSPD